MRFEKGITPWNKGIKRTDISGVNHHNWRGTKGFKKGNAVWKKSQEQNKICEKCGIKYKTITANQRWCCECVPDGKSRQRLKKYNLSLPEYQDLLNKDNGICRICLKREVEVIDHCHKTGKIRGLICRRCNLLLPIVEDKELLERAIKYLGR